MNTSFNRFRMWHVLTALVLASLAVASCEVEFTPNAEWKNVPVVYCVLDQDDDTSWVRLERCYLSSDGLFNYGSDPDSIHYDSAAVSVAVLAYSGETLRDSIPFSYTLRPRSEGQFASGLQPAYFALTHGRLKEEYTYVLRVRNTADNSVLASSKPISLIRTTQAQHIIKPSYTINMSGDTLGLFNFPDFVGGEACCKFEWVEMENARLYQPVVRFFYVVEDTLKHLDLRCQRTSAHRYVHYPRQVFLDEIKARLQDDPRPKRYTKHVDVYLHACTEELNAYMESVSQGSALDQNRAVYGNMDGGIGIFAARRTHLYKPFPADTTSARSASNASFYPQLEALGVGIYM
ncbi:MAG: DUF4249 family protein [Bacteroidales bacterium]|nr:DUF4249 family protein [Bacteroidales bacterium]